MPGRETSSTSARSTSPPSARWSRRSSSRGAPAADARAALSRVTRGGFLKLGLAGAGTLVVGGATLYELVEHGVLPGEADARRRHRRLRRRASAAPLRARQARRISKTVLLARAQPRGRVHDRVPAWATSRATACRSSSCSTGRAAITRAEWADLRLRKPWRFGSTARRFGRWRSSRSTGAAGYWNPHPGDDPMGMVVDELIPLCRAARARPGAAQGRRPRARRWAVTARSSSRRSSRISSAPSPRSVPPVWTSYAQASGVNAAAYASPAAFAAADVVTHARALAGIPVQRRLGERRPVPAGSQGTRKGASAGLGRRLLRGLPLRVVLPPADAAVTRVPLPAPRESHERAARWDPRDSSRSALLAASIKWAHHWGVRADLLVACWGVATVGSAVVLAASRHVPATAALESDAALGEARDLAGRRVAGGSRRRRGRRRGRDGPGWRLRRRLVVV